MSKKGSRKLEKGKRIKRGGRQIRHRTRKRIIYDGRQSKLERGRTIQGSP